MNTRRYLATLLISALVIGVLGLGGCASTPPPSTVDPNTPASVPADQTTANPLAIDDPLSPLNRRIYRFNALTDRYVLLPAVQDGGDLKAALDKASAADINKVKELVSAAVGAREDRGDKVTVVMRAFEKVEAEGVPFYETSWFGMAVRNGVALLAVLLVLFLAVRPAIKALRSGPKSPDALPAPLCVQRAVLLANPRLRATFPSACPLPRRLRSPPKWLSARANSIRKRAESSTASGVSVACPRCRARPIIAW